MIWLLQFALAATPRVVHPGETLEGMVNDPALVAQLRQQYRLKPGEQPTVGTVLMLPGEDTSGMVLTLTGSGTLTAPGTPPRALAAGLPLSSGTLICTNSNSYTTLRLAISEGDVAHDEVTLLSNTCLTINGASAQSGHRSSLVELQSGSLSVRDSGTKTGSVAVRTTDGVTTGEAGGFRVAVEQGATRTESLLHPVSVIGAGTEVNLRANEGSRVLHGKAPSPPVTLPTPGAPVSPADQGTLRRPAFTWAPVGDALGYRIEIATDEGFTEIVRQQDIGGSPWIPEMLFVPFRVPCLYWRVISFDRNGFFGVPSAARRLLFPQGMGP